MSQIYESLKGLICPSMVPTAARIVGEKEANVSTAVSSIFASLLAVMLKNGNSPQMRNVLETAGNLNILSDIGNICEERPTEEQRKIGDDYLQLLLGDRAADFTNPIAKHAGISSVATNRLISMLAPVTAGYLGRKLVKDGWSLHKILNEIENQKKGFEALVPNELARTFGLASLLGTTTTTTTSGNTVREPEKKKNNGWITWLIIILVILLIIFLWRSCRNTNTNTVSNVNTVYTDSVMATPASLGRTAPLVESPDRTRVADRPTTQLTLADGARITVYQNGTEQEMINFINSDEYRNASDADLQDRWFQFDNIAFEFNSATELKPESRQQINNIVAILRNNPNVRIKIAGFADRVGSDQVNMEISQQRAQTIERIFEEAGVGSQVVRTQGYGAEYATHSVNAPDSLRAQDRDIALRFVK